MLRRKGNELILQGDTRKRSSYKRRRPVREGDEHKSVRMPVISLTVTPPGS